MSKASRGHHRAHEEHEEHEEHVNHEAWVIPYADMLTLLMALFLVLFAVGRTDLEKFKKLAQSFRNEFGNSSEEVIDMGGTGIGTGGDGGAGMLESDMPPPSTAATTTTLSPAEEALGEKQAAEQAAQAEADSLEGVRESLQAAANAFGIGDSLNLTLDGRGLVVTIVTDQVLFAPGKADLQPDGLSILDVVGQALLNVPNDISVEGHTDNRPLGGGGRFRDNWDLSNARATSVLRYFMEQNGLPPERLSATGYADTRPAADNDTDEGRAKNRRVEVIVKAAVSLDPVFDDVSGEITTGEDVQPDVEPDVDPDVDPGVDPNIDPGAQPDIEAVPASGVTTAATTPTASETEAEVASEPPIFDPNVVPDLSPGLQPVPAGGTGG